jgi:hypothetical protein
MVACIDFFEMSEICRPKFIVRHSTPPMIGGTVPLGFISFPKRKETFQIEKDVAGRRGGRGHKR